MRNSKGWARALGRVLPAMMAAALLAAPGPAAAQRFDGVTIRVSTWGGSWRDRIQELIGADFESKGGKVEYVIGNALENFNKLLAARGQKPPFDVMEFQSDVWKALRESGVLMPLPYAAIPNAAGHAASQKDAETVATWTLEEGIVYNAEKLAAAGIAKPEKYSDLFQPKLAGRIAWPDISYGPYALIGLATEFGGDELNVQPGLDRIRQANVGYFYRSSVELSTKFASGDVWAAPWHAGWAVRVKRTGLPLAMSFPKVKDRHGVIASGMIGIVKGTAVGPAAEYWVNRYLSPEVQEALGRANGIAPVNAAALAKLKADPLLAELMLLTPEAIAGTYAIDWSRIDLADIVDKWNRVTAR
ncbi:MAG: extracellular solute-binding protein [Alphaproteobacteria bacterium]|nr:extracellular solute-binding protein [Alphaproteobacteria bacterium]